MRAFFKVIALVLCISLILPICSLSSFAGFKGEPSLTVIKSPNRVDYYEGIDWHFNREGEVSIYSDLDISGAVIGIDGEEVNYHVFPWGPNMICMPKGNGWHLGENDACIVLDEVDDLYAPIKVYFHSLVNVTFGKPPTTEHYIRGLHWDYNDKGKIAVNDIYLDGMVLNVEYSDGSTQYIQNDDKLMLIDWEIDDDDFVYKLGYNEFVAVFSGWRIPFGIYIELDKATGITKGSNPSRASYDFNKDWFMIRGKPYADIDLHGMSITAKYNNGKSLNVTYNDNPEKFQIVPNQTLTPGFNNIKVIYDSQIEFTTTIYLLMMGDVDFDGMISSSDALLVLRHIVGSLEFNERQLPYADVNDDGQINSADALCIQYRCVGLIKAFDAEL